MALMRTMVKKEVKYRNQWRRDPAFRKRKAQRNAFLQWSGGILLGPCVPQGLEDEPPLHLMPPAFPIASRAGKYELINLVDSLALQGIEDLEHNWSDSTWAQSWIIAEQK